MIPFILFFHSHLKATCWILDLRMTDGQRNSERMVDVLQSLPRNKSPGSSICQSCPALSDDKEKKRVQPSPLRTGRFLREESRCKMWLYSPVAEQPLFLWKGSYYSPAFKWLFISSFQGRRITQCCFNVEYHRCMAKIIPITAKAASLTGKENSQLPAVNKEASCWECVSIL